MLLSIGAVPVDEQSYRLNRVQQNLSSSDIEVELRLQRLDGPFEV